MIVALGQFAVSTDWQKNAARCVRYMQDAACQGASLLVLPEAALATDIQDPLWVIREAQPLDGPFMRQLLIASAALPLTTVLTLHVPAEAGRVYNLLVVLHQGQIIAQYRKLHLYDAFSMKESTHVQAGHELPPVIEVAGVQVGVMTCYDLRFPEVAKSLALRGAELLVVPAAWVKGPYKVSHWETLVQARALDTTCFVAAVSECGPRNIGCSRLVDPLGNLIAHAAEAPTLVVAALSLAQLRQVREVLPVLANSRFVPPALA